MEKLHEAMLFEKLSANRIKCNLCSHRCLISEGNTGICNVRKNIGGTLYTFTFGKVVALHADPIEKKPLFNFLPGSSSFSLATPGCNFRCSFCQNWEISQFEEKGENSLSRIQFVEPEQIIQSAQKQKCQSISYTYTEPTIFFEYAYEISKLAHAQGIKNVFVTNGFMTSECLEMIASFLDAANVDLKSFSDDFYRKVCKGRLAPVLESIKLMHKLGIWVEITTLLVPGLNDGEAELTKLAEFIAGVDPNIPWHISRFHPDYKLTDAQPTSIESLHQAKAIGKKAGLRYVYTGNIPGDEGENTHCYQCGEILISRFGFTIRKNVIKNNHCPKCGAKVAGVYEKN